MTKLVSVEPRISEKTYDLREKGVYVFDVSMSANKLTVKQAVEKHYGVKVADVRALVLKGKTKRSVRKRTQPRLGRRSDTKKMYVTLQPGQKIAALMEEK